MLGGVLHLNNTAVANGLGTWALPVAAVSVGTWAVAKALLLAAGIGAVAVHWKREPIQHRLRATSRALAAAAAAATLADADDSESDSELHGEVSSDTPAPPAVPDPLSLPLPEFSSCAAQKQSLHENISQSPCVVVVDPVSTGAQLADAYMRAGYSVVRITSSQHSANWHSHHSEDDPDAPRSD